MDDQLRLPARDKRRVYYLCTAVISLFSFCACLLLQQHSNFGVGLFLNAPLAVLLSKNRPCSAIHVFFVGDYTINQEMRIAFLAWLCLFLPVAYSILEEQAGELEWKIDGIGEIVQSVSKNKRLYVATAEGVLACLHTNSSTENEQQQLLWRAKLPPTTVIHQLIIGKVPSGTYDVFTISSVVSSSLDNQQPTTPTSPLFMLSGMYSPLFPFSHPTDHSLTSPSLPCVVGFITNSLVSGSWDTAVASTVRQQQ